MAHSSQKVLQLVPAPLVAAYHRRMVNIHPGLLPEFGGPSMYGTRVHAATLESGELWLLESCTLPAWIRTTRPAKSLLVSQVAPAALLLQSSRPSCCCWASGHGDCLQSPALQVFQGRLAKAAGHYMRLCASTCLRIMPITR